MDYKIPFTIMFPAKPYDRCVSMATHYKKMQRVLLGYENTGLVVFSVNKGAVKQKINFLEQDPSLKKLLACTWTPDCT